MPNIVANFLSQFAAALVVGVMFAAWIALYPTTQSQSSYIDQHQQMIRRLNVPIPVLGALAIVFTVSAALLVRDHRATTALLLGGALCLVISGIVTRVGNQPINAKIMLWNPAAPPPDWIHLRDRWWTFHIVRSLSGAIGFGLILAAQATRSAF